MQSFEKMQKRKKKQKTSILHQNEGKRVKKERNSKPSVKHGVLCYGIGVYACQWNRVTAGY